MCCEITELGLMSSAILRNSGETVFQKCLTNSAGLGDLLFGILLSAV